MPFLFRFGAEKGRLIYLIAVGALTAFAVTLANMGYENPFDFGAANFVICALSVLMYIVSWRVSVSLYKAREL